MESNSANQTRKQASKIEREGKMSVASTVPTNQAGAPASKKIAETYNSSGKKVREPGRWSLQGKTALVTGGTRGIGYDSSTPFSLLSDNDLISLLRARATRRVV
jgi:hypothetical protein